MSTVKSTELILWVASSSPSSVFFSSLGSLERDSERYYKILVIELKHSLYFSSHLSLSLALNGLIWSFALPKAVDLLCFTFFVVLPNFEPPFSNYVVLKEMAFHTQHDFLLGQGIITKKHWFMFPKHGLEQKNKTKLHEVPIFFTTAALGFQIY